jgi:hypothetical protein
VVERGLRCLEGDVKGVILYITTTTRTIRFGQRWNGNLLLCLGRMASEGSARDARASDLGMQWNGSGAIVLGNKQAEGIILRLL